MLHCYVSTFLLTVVVGFSNSQEAEVVMNALDFDADILMRENINGDESLLDDKLKTMSQADEKVDIKCYYESLCPDSRTFYISDLEPVVIKLGDYIHLQNYPYGNAQTFERNGTIEFHCQHGPPECYGNKLHACALDILSNGTEAVLYNTCMMDYSQEGRGSDDTAADKCGKSMSVDSGPIKECAKGDKGTKLLKYYGDESRKISYNYVPFILLDGKENDGQNFFRDVCEAIKHPPPDCNEILQQ